MTVIFREHSDSGNFSSYAEDSTRIFLIYKPAKQSAWLSREDAEWLSHALEMWELSYFSHFAKTNKSRAFAVTAEDDLSIFIYYEKQTQGAWMPREDAMWLKGTIDRWMARTDE